MAQVIGTSQVTKIYEENVAVDHVDLDVQQGSIYGIAGANGAGKSTLLRMLVGLSRPTSGAVYFFREPLPTDCSKLNERVQFVSPDAEMYSFFRVNDMIKYASLLYKRWDERRAAVLLEALELPASRYIRSLSLGMRMQLRLAIALSARPDVLILDEPTNGLDPVVKHQLLQLVVEETASRGVTTVIATHELEDIERITDKAAFMCRGRIVGVDSIDAWKGRIKGIQAVIHGELNSRIANHPAIAHLARRGPHVSMVVDGASPEVTQLLFQQNATHVNEYELSFGEVFRFIMEREGYVRDRITLP
jgi:ABC-2 type transport system ATP-binding protein